MAQRLVRFLTLLITLRALRLMMLSRPDSLKANFKKPGKNGMNIFRGVMITGPPGIGKTTSAHLCAKLAGFTPIELNASDARSKKLVEVSFLLQGHTVELYSTE
jgi:DNA polymerase III delta prime subunit